MSERQQITVSIAGTMAGPYFRRGMIDARDGNPWPREADVWQYVDQLGYEWGRTFAVAYGERAASFYDADGVPRARAERAFMELKQHGYVS